jgi:hypothetical protein
LQRLIEVVGDVFVEFWIVGMVVVSVVSVEMWSVFCLRQAEIGAMGESLGECVEYVSELCRG